MRDTNAEESNALNTNTHTHPVTDTYGYVAFGSHQHHLRAGNRPGLLGGGNLDNLGPHPTPRNFSHARRSCYFRFLQDPTSVARGDTDMPPVIHRTVPVLRLRPNAKCRQEVTVPPLFAPTLARYKPEAHSLCNLPSYDGRLCRTCLYSSMQGVNPFSLSSSTPKRSSF